VISVLIPIYNYNCLPLVVELQKQFRVSGVPYEIICLDDASQENYMTTNRKIDALEFCSYSALPENVGRSKIRNLLSERANYDYLLFIDCDSVIISDDYVSNYLKCLPSAAVICGGRIYQKKKPLLRNLCLHWKYGSIVESKNAGIRSKSPYKSFMTNNFIIPKNIFRSLLFNEGLKGYGHEDTLLGIQLKKKQVPIVHIQNPLLHEGIEDAVTFINKTGQGVCNLKLLYKQKLVNDGDVTLIRFYSLVKRFGIEGMLLRYFKKNEKKIVLHLTSANPSLWLFSFYKLAKFCEA
jgi:glycosyltransferase involved in cell wall biosynthesis